MNKFQDTTFSNFEASGDASNRKPLSFKDFEYIPAKEKSPHQDYPELIKITESSGKKSSTLPEILPEESNILPSENSSEMFTQEFLKDLFTYLDSLFQQLPDHTIKEFSQSPYYEKYNNLLDTLNI